MSDASQDDNSQLGGLLEKALSHFQASRFGEARAVLQSALKLRPDSFDALNLAGVAATRTGHPAEGIALFEQAIALRPEHFGAYNNLGLALRSLGRNEAAAEAYARAVALEPAYAAAHANLGAALLDLRRYPDALDSCNRSLALRPDHPGTLVLRGNILKRLRRHNEAMECFDRAIEIAPRDADAHNARGDCLRDMGLADAALAAYEQALELSPGQAHLLDSVAMSRLKICDWRGFDDLVRNLVARVGRGEWAMRPFSSLIILDDPALQLKVAEKFAERFSAVPAPAIIRPRPERIHVAYFSADFKNHATMHLMGELFALRDRERFKVSAFAFNIGAGDEYTTQARSLVDEYVDVDGIPDAAVAAMARERGVDIAVECKGYTKGARTAIFSHRAAPLQVSYLAYPGTMGAPFIDYLVADKVVVPRESFGHYSEKIVWMPESYAPRDTRVQVPDRGLTREAVGLPRDGFVFCSFNQSTKFLPALFADWMDILSRVEGSVLWLLDSGPVAAKNLRGQAAALGIAPERLVFAPKRDQVDHLERLRLVDLCLDTLPYNAHTTASDALYVGVPIITRPGASFASRVCASLLASLGMNELVVEDDAAYRNVAVHLAHDRARLDEIKTRLLQAKTSMPLYDMGRYVRALETAYVTMFERQQRGLPPKHLAVELT